MFKFPLQKSEGLYEKILVVDDDKSIRLVLSTALTRSGFLVKTSATTAGYLGLLNADKFDVMITDVGLPDGDTLDCCQNSKLKSKHENYSYFS